MQFIIAIQQSSWHYMRKTCLISQDLNANLFATTTETIAFTFKLIYFFQNRRDQKRFYSSRAINKPKLSKRSQTQKCQFFQTLAFSTSVALCKTNLTQIFQTQQTRHVRTFREVCSKSSCSGDQDHQEVDSNA